MKRFCVSRATIEYSHVWIEAETEEEAIQIAKDEPLDWSFDTYSDDGALEELSKDKDGDPTIIEYEIQDEEESVGEDEGE